MLNIKTLKMESIEQLKQKMDKIQSFQSDKDRLFKIIYDTMGVTQKQILGPRGKRYIVSARQIFVYCLRSNGYTLIDAGLAANRDHATVIHSIKQVDAVISIKDIYSSVFKQIIKEYNGTRL